MDTTERLVFPAGAFPAREASPGLYLARGKPELVLGDGDGTVNTRSLEVATATVMTVHLV